MRVLVTGAAGRLGGSVCRLLAKCGILFTAVDRNAGSRLEYPIEVADLQDREACRKVVRGVDAVAHFANKISWADAEPDLVYAENVTMNVNLFQAAASAGCRRIVFSSSIQVIDGQLPLRDRSKHDVFIPYLPMDSSMPAQPRNSYALSKVATEQMLEYFAHTDGITSIALRFPYLLDQENLEAAARKGGMARGNPYDCFAYLPLESAAEAAVCALTADVSGYRSYFVASRDNLEQRPAAEVIAEGLAHLPDKRSREQADSLVDCAVAERELGWVQPRSLQESYDKYCVKGQDEDRED